MAGTDGQAPDPVTSNLAREPFAFDFFRAIRLLENLRPDLPRIGYSLSPAQDPVRFGQKPSLAFAPSTLESLEPSSQPGIPRLYVNCFGLFGPNGPLPLHLTEYAFQRDYNEHDRTFSAFADIFHHRLISLFYRAWADNQKTVDMDRPQTQRFSIFIGSLFGLGMESLQDHDSVQDLAKLYFSGRLSCQPRNAEGLGAILQDYFEIKTEVLPFAGRWVDLPAQNQYQMGRATEAGRLGFDLILGERFLTVQLAFRLRLGPMSLADYQRMLPGGDACRRLRSWVLNYCGEHFFWDAQLVLKASEVPETQLGRAGKLGWTTWLKSQPAAHDVEDLILNPAQNELCE